MIGRISNFRGGRHTRHNDQVIVELGDLSKMEAKQTREGLVKLMGKKVVYKTKTKSIIGKVSRLHGKSALIAKFDKGLPGEAISENVLIE